MYEGILRCLAATGQAEKMEDTFIYPISRSTDLKKVLSSWKMIGDAFVTWSRDGLEELEEYERHERKGQFDSTAVYNLPNLKVCWTVQAGLAYERAGYAEAAAKQYESSALLAKRAAEMYRIALKEKVDASDFKSASALAEKIGNLYSSLNLKAFDKKAVSALNNTHKFYAKYYNNEEKLAEGQEALQNPGNAKDARAKARNARKIRFETMKTIERHLKDKAEKLIAHISSRTYPASSKVIFAGDGFVCKDAIVNKMISDEKLGRILLDALGNTVESKSIVSIAKACERSVAAVDDSMAEAAVLEEEDESEYYEDYVA
jgi:hypothetical protein